MAASDIKLLTADRNHTLSIRNMHPNPNQKIWLIILVAAVLGGVFLKIRFPAPRVLPERVNQSFLTELARYQTPETVRAFQNVIRIFNDGGQLSSSRADLFPGLLRSMVDTQEHRFTDAGASNTAWGQIFIVGVTTDLQSPKPSIRDGLGWKPDHYVVPRILNVPASWAVGQPIPNDAMLVFEFVDKDRAEHTPYVLGPSASSR